MPLIHQLKVHASSHMDDDGNITANQKMRRKRSRASAAMLLILWVWQKQEEVSQLSMFRRRFPDLPQSPTAGHILDSCSLTLHGKTLSHDLWCHVLIGQECEPESYVSSAECLLLSRLTPRLDKNIPYPCPVQPNSKRELKVHQTPSRRTILI